MIVLTEMLYYFLVRLHTTAKAVSEAEYSSYGATKQGAQVTQVCFPATIKNLHNGQFMVYKLHMCISTISYSGPEGFVRAAWLLPCVLW